MHEAGLASSVADAMRRNGLDQEGPPVRLIVRGGHTEEAAFDASLRLHLQLRLPELDPSRLTIVHAPRPASCIACGGSFMADTTETPCPTCGAPGLMQPGPESIELEWT